jgi:hypothetical protein
MGSRLALRKFVTQASYYTAESENGEAVADPSEDALFMRISDLELPGNTNLVVEPSYSGASWYAVVGLLEGGGYEVEYSNPARNQHEVVEEQELGRLCRDLTLWLAGAVRHDQQS